MVKISFLWAAIAISLLLFIATGMKTVQSQSAGSIVGPTVSNPTVAAFIINTPSVYNYFLVYPNQVVAILTNPAMAGIDSNPQEMIAFLGNPSFGTLLMNYSNFSTFTSNPAFSAVVSNQQSFSSLLSNPSLTSIMNNQTGFNSVVSSPGFAVVSQNPAALSNALSNPVISQISGTQLTTFVTNPQFSTIVNNPTQFSSIMSNPSLSFIITSPGLGTLVSSGAYATLSQNPQFVAVLGTPSFGAFLQNPSLPAIESNPAQLNALITNPSLSPITSNSYNLASLLTNPSLSVIAADPSGLSILVSGGNLANIAANPGELSIFLSSPSLSAINSQPALFVSFITNSQIAGFVSNPTMFSILLSNPSFPTVMSNPTNLGILLTTPSTEPLISNTQSLEILLASPNLGTISTNPQGFATIMSTTQIAPITSNPVQFSILLNNPALPGIMGNPTQFQLFLSTSSLSPVFTNSAQFTSLLSNPSLDVVMLNPSGVSAVLTLPGIASASSSNPLIITNLLSNPSLATIASNPTQVNAFGAFVISPTYVSITSSPVQFAAILSNPSLSVILSSQTQLSVVLSSSSVSALQSGNPVAFASLLGNPALISIIYNPVPFTSMLSTPGLSPLLNNPTQLSSLLSNPSLDTIAENPGNLGTLADDPAASQFTSSPAFSNLLSNPALPGILDNPTTDSELQSLATNPGINQTTLASPGMDALMANPDALQSLLDNPSFDSMESDPTELNSFLGGPGLAGIMSGSDPSAVLGNPDLGDAINNPASSSLLSSSTALGSTITNTDLSGFLSSGGLGTPGSPSQCVSIAVFPPTVGTCIYQASTTVQTAMTGREYTIQRATTPNPPPSNVPVIQDVLKKNSVNSQILLTCPGAPNPQSSQGYFTLDNQLFVAGNSCMANEPNPFLSIVTLTTTVTWSSLTPAFAVQSYNVASIAGGWTMPVAYSGETGTPTSQAYNLSNGYNTESYIFDQVPSSPQQAVWTWSAVYADLSLTNLAQLESTGTIHNLIYGPITVPTIIPPFFVSCTFSYDYSVDSKITGVNNINITIPSFDAAGFASKQYLNVSGYMYTSLSSTSIPSCNSQLLAGANCGGWTKMSENATLYLGGTSYNGLNAYIGNGGGSILAAYPGGLAVASTSKISTVNISFVPYLLFNSSIPTAYTQLSSSISYLNSSYNLYSTHNYMSPGKYLDPFQLDTDSAFIGTYNGFLSLFPANLSSLDYPDSNSLAKYQSNLLTTIPTGQINQYPGAFSNQQALGSYVFGGIQNPVFITTSPSGDVYVLKYTQDNCPNGILSFCIGSSTVSYLYRLHTIPEGYVNLSSYPPTSQGTQDNVDAWKNEWTNYYANAILQGSQDIYVANTYLLSSTMSSVFTGTQSNGGLLNKFIPLAITSDNNGDVFILGAHITGAVNNLFGSGATDFTLFGILSNGKKIGTEVTSPARSTTPFIPAFIPSAEFAASPDGQYVYVANASYGAGGQILIYLASTTGSPSSSSSTPTAALAAPAPSASSTSITSGSPVTLTANPTGGTSPYAAYQWYTGLSSSSSGSSTTCQSLTAISGATSSTYTESPTTSNSYCYKVTDSATPTAATAYSAITQITVGGSTSTALTCSIGTGGQISGTTMNGAQMFEAILNDLNVPCTTSVYSNDELLLATWAQFESPSYLCGTSSCADYNPLSTTQTVSGCATPFNTAGVEAYSNYQTGAAAIAKTISNGRYPNILSGLMQGQTPSVYATSATSNFNTWVTGSATGSSYSQSFFNELSQVSTMSGLLAGDLSHTGPIGSTTGCNGGVSGTSGTATPTPPPSFFNGALSGGFTYVGNIPLTYSNATFNMNLVKYLQNGGPYSDPTVAKAYASQTGVIQDTDVNHHPVAIVDTKGILYVIDNWTFTVDGVHDSSVLMLRAFAENGTEIPIDPTSTNTLSPISTLPGALATSLGTGSTPANGWPPYGWPLSASITLPSGQVISYCAAMCTYDPANMIASNIPVFNSTDYQAIGPHIDTASGAVGNAWNGISISSDFNGTLYLIAHPWSFNTKTTTCTTSGYIINIIGAILANAGTPATGALAAGGAAGGSYCVAGTTYSVSTPANPLYTELLVMHPVIENYTKVEFAANTSYVCYLNVPPPTNSPCIYDQNTKNYLGNLYPPLVGVPSAFEYAENLGGPEQYLNLQNAFSAVFPTLSTSQYSSGANSVAQNGITGQPNYNSLASSTLSSSGQTLPKLPTTYIKSSVSGYILTPYKISGSLTQTYSNIQVYTGSGGSSSGGSGTGFGPSSGGSGTSSLPSTLATCQNYALGATLLSYFVGGTSTSTKFTYQTTQLTQNPVPSTTSPFLNATIESGDTYAQYIPFQSDYIPNISDSGLILSPYIDLQIFTNRILGEIFINQTVSPKTAASIGAVKQGLPVVVNAINNYTYSEVQFNQVPPPIAPGVPSGTGVYAYIVQIGQPLQSATIGANCGSSCPSPYYYSSKYFSGPSNLTFNTSTPNPVPAFQLFELFKTARYLDSLILNLTKASSASTLGYNRFVYTYVDRFNNTVYMPIDLDFANISEISVNSTVAVNTVNTNQSTVTVNGIALYSTPNGLLPLPMGSPIYLYYDTNINYLNATSSATQNPTGYYQYAMQCAFAPSSKSCVLANPLSTLTQPQPIGSQEANAVSYTPELNSGGACIVQPNSLLTPQSYNCNIYGNNGLSSVTQAAGQSGYEYCVPVFANGTGHFTSQLGLLDIASTSSNGMFSYSFTACGASQDSVTAYYYGSNAPEPIIVQQSPLSESGGSDEFSPQDTLKSPEFNYTYAPNQTATFFSIGSYSLSIGAISIAELLAAMGTVSLIIIIRTRRTPSKGVHAERENKE
jgi:hypothetical protein